MDLVVIVTGVDAGVSFDGQIVQTPINNIDPDVYFIGASFNFIYTGAVPFNKNVSITVKDDDPSVVTVLTPGLNSGFLRRYVSLNTNNLTNPVRLQFLVDADVNINGTNPNYSTEFDFKKVSIVALIAQATTSSSIKMIVRNNSLPIGDPNSYNTITFTFSWVLSFTGNANNQRLINMDMLLPLLYQPCDLSWSFPILTIPNT